MPKKQEKNKPNLVAISDPFAQEEEWLHAASTQEECGSDYTSGKFLTKCHVPCLCTLALACCIMFIVQWQAVQLHSHAQPAALNASRVSIVGQSTADEETNTPPVPQPAFLKGLLPKVVRALDITNVDESKGRFKLIVWAENFNDSQIGLVEVKDGKSMMVWQSDKTGWYSPAIQSLPGCTCNGHQVYLVFWQSGAAWQWVQPVYIEGETVQMLTTFDRERFEVREFSDHKSRLIGYHREFLPQMFNKPTIYNWTGQDFELSTCSQRKLYYDLLKTRKEDYDDFDVDDAELVDAERLAEDGQKKAALGILSKIKRNLAKNHSAGSMQRCAELMRVLGKDGEAVQMALAERKLILSGFQHATRDEINNQIGTAENCAGFFAELGKETEAISLLKAIRHAENQIYKKGKPHHHLGLTDGDE